MNINSFLEKLNKTPQAIAFTETMAVIEATYNYEPTAFENGILHNQAGENAGSCKIFAFAELHNLSSAATLACFGEYYMDVLNNPEASNHQNIRNFIKTGWDGIAFYGSPLSLKKE